MRVVRFTSSMRQTYDSMTFDWHKKWICWSEDIYREHVLAYLNHSFMTCSGYEAITSIPIYYKYGVNPLRRVWTLYPENPLGAPLLIINEKYPCMKSVINVITDKRIPSDILWWGVHGLQTTFFFTFQKSEIDDKPFGQSNVIGLQLRVN